MKIDQHLLSVPILNAMLTVEYKLEHGSTVRRVGKVGAPGVGLKKLKQNFKSFSFIISQR